MAATSLKAAALSLASKGIAVVPLHTPRDGKCSCGKGAKCPDKGKHPQFDPTLLPKGIKNASADPAIIEEWWDRWPDANIGIATGSRSKVYVVDVDGPEGEKSVLDALNVESLDDFAAATTGREGGMHLYFRHEGGPLPNTLKLLPGVDTRGEGGYVVAPPSLHETGRRYAWREGGRPQPIPPGLLALIKSRTSDNGHQKLTAEDWGRKLVEGERNTELTRRAGKLLAHDIPPNIVYKTLVELDAQLNEPPLGAQAIKKIVVSISRRERSKQEEKTSQPQDFPLLTFAEALHKFGNHETQWMVNEWLPESTVGLVVAPPGAYKTWMLADLCTAVVGARDFLGQFPVENTGPVILIQQEDFLPMLFSRICRMLVDGRPTEDGDEFSLPIYRTDLPIYTHERRMLHFRNRNVVRALSQKIEQIRPKLVLIDPLYTAVDMKDYMSESAQQMMVLKDLRDKYGCSFMIAHHTTKSPGDEGRQRDQAWGSQFINAWLETGWQLREVGEPHESRVSVQRHFKVADNPQEVELKFHIDDYTYHVDINDSESAAQRTGKHDQAIIDFLTQNNVSSKKAISDHIGIASKRLLYRRLDVLGIVKTEDGFYKPLSIEMEDEE